MPDFGIFPNVSKKTLHCFHSHHVEASSSPTGDAMETPGKLIPQRLPSPHWGLSSHSQYQIKLSIIKIELLIFSPPKLSTLPLLSIIPGTIKYPDSLSLVRNLGIQRQGYLKPHISVNLYKNLLRFYSYAYTNIGIMIHRWLLHHPTLQLLPESTLHLCTH